MLAQAVTPTYTECPIVQQAEDIFANASNLRTAINKLRGDMRMCHSCAYHGECPSMVRLNREIDSAIEQLTVEWGLV